MSYLLLPPTPRRRLGVLQTSAKRLRHISGLGAFAQSGLRYANPRSTLMRYRGRGWGQQAPQTNPAGGPPSTINNYDAQGNPIYATPPPGQVVTSYDASGTPVYGNPSTALPNSGYSTGTAAQIVGYDAFGNPIYGAPGTSITQPSTAAPSTSVSVAPTTATDYSTILDWFSEQTLITGVPNWGILAGLGLAYVWFQHRGRR